MNEFMFFLTWVSVIVSLVVLILLIYFLIYVPKHLESIVRVLRLIAYTGIPDYKFKSVDKEKKDEFFKNNT